MGIYNFQPRFSPKILDHSKLHTIRARRKYEDKPGDTMHLYTGLRHPGAVLLLRAPCVWAAPVKIKAEGMIVVDGMTLSDTELEELARRDGFDDHPEMIRFWQGRLPFDGRITGWNPEIGEHR